MIWAKIAAFIHDAVASKRLPEEAKLDHTINNYHLTMIAAERIANRIARKQENNPKRAEIQALKEQSVSTIEALVRDMQQGRR